MFAVSIAGSLFFATVGTADSAGATPEFEYAPGACRGAWTFSAVANTAGLVPVEWCYRGSRSRFQARARLEQFVRRAGEEIVNLAIAEAGPAPPSTRTPSSFAYTGVARFDLEPGDVYGFRLATLRSPALAPQVS
jgi:hypothetical protein